jgi:hypothetical protein
MIGADHSFNSIPYLITFISGIAATWLTLYFKVIRPRMTEHRKHEGERAQQAQEEHDWLHGKPATMSSPEIISAPIQLRAVQDSQEQVVGELKVLTLRMDESNGTARKTKEDVADIKEMLKNAIAIGAEATMESASGEKHTMTLNPESHEALQRLANPEQ